jgi:hypothetical protein
MVGRPGRFSQLRWLQTVVCVAGMVGALGLLGLAITGHASSAGVWMAAAACFVLLWSIVTLTTFPLLLKMESTLARQLGELRDLKSILSKHGASLEAIADHTRISDAANSLVHRETEMQALHATVHEAIRRERWEHALVLVDEIERRLGYRREAERMREELDGARTAAIQTKLAEAIELIETHFQAHNWGLAQSEIDRLHQALPDDAKVLSLQDRMQTLKQQHKGELKSAWDEAVRRSDTDQAIEVLKELDQYLSTAEAQALRASARHVFKEKLLRLGVQFRFAVTEKRWRDALSSGLELAREFPNARMASEVREALDTLRERARHSDDPQAAGPEIEEPATTQP